MRGKYFDLPFATGGDKTSPPDATDPSGFVSYNQGFTFDYQRQLYGSGADPAAKSIVRQNINGINNDITQALQYLQTQPFPEFITSLAGGYALNAIVLYSTSGNPPFDMYISTTAANTTVPLAGGNHWKSISALLQGGPFVQQGTGVGQLTNVVKIGWSASAKTKITIDTTDQGNIAMEPWTTTNFQPAGNYVRGSGHTFTASYDATNVLEVINVDGAITFTNASTTWIINNFFSKGQYNFNPAASGYWIMPTNTGQLAIFQWGTGTMNPGAQVWSFPVAHGGSVFGVWANVGITIFSGTSPTYFGIQSINNGQFETNSFWPSSEGIWWHSIGFS